VTGSAETARLPKSVRPMIARAGHRAKSAWTTLRRDGVGTLATKAARPFFVGSAARALAQAPRDAAEAHAFLTGFKHREIEVVSWQLDEEIEPLLELVRDEQPRSVVEIGSAAGGTLFLLTRVAGPDAVIVSVDLPGGMANPYPRWRSRLYEQFARDRQRVYALRKDSHDERTLREVRRLSEPVDFLFIDGDHSYGGVSRDLEMYGPLVRSGGLIAFHDIVPPHADGHGDPGEVPKFWQEVKTRYSEHREFVKDWNWGSCGIGVIRVP
jgi:predicted O-methyltransferase YrrM